MSDNSLFENFFGNLARESGCELRDLGVYFCMISNTFVWNFGSEGTKKSSISRENSPKNSTAFPVKQQKTNHFRKQNSPTPLKLLTKNPTKNPTNHHCEICSRLPLNRSASTIRITDSELMNKQRFSEHLSPEIAAHCRRSMQTLCKAVHPLCDVMFNHRGWCGFPRLQVSFRGFWKIAFFVEKFCDVLRKDFFIDFCGKFYGFFPRNS